MTDNKTNTSSTHHWADHTLKLSHDLETVARPEGRVFIKQKRFATYMALLPGQRELLELFTGTRPLSEIAADVLKREIHPNLQVFYALVVDAVEKGVLEDSSGKTQPDIKPARPASWWVGWPSFSAVLLSIPIILLAMIPMKTVLSSPPLIPAYWLFIFLSVGAIMSLAMLASGCVLRGSGRQVYDCRLKSRLVIPFLSIDTRDAFMGGRLCEAAVALQALATPCLVAIVAFIFKQYWLLIAGFMALLMLSSPFGDTPAHDLLFAIFRKGQQPPKRGNTHRFLDRRLFTHVFGRVSPLTEETYLLTYTIYAILWLGGLLVSVRHLFGTQAPTLINHMRFGEHLAERSISLVVLAVFAALIAAPILYQIWILAANLWRTLKTRFSPTEAAVRRRSITGGDLALDKRISFLKEDLLFGQLDDQTIRSVAEAMELVTLPDRTTVIHENERGDSLYVVYSGDIDILKEDDTGNPCEVAALQSGGIFGEIALLENVPRTATAITRGKTSLLILSRDQFEKIVVAGLGADQIKSTIQVSAFLRDTELFLGWPDEALLAVSREFSLEDFKNGDIVIEEGASNNLLYVVYEGTFEVRHNDQPSARLTRGNFFGEISLLENIPATAEVTAIGPGRCLSLARSRFRDLVTRDVLTGAFVGNMAAQRAMEGGVS